MNTIHANISIKSITFETLRDVKLYRNKTLTDKARQVAHLISSCIKAVDKEVFYTFNIHTSLWEIARGNDFTNYCFDFFNQTAINIKLIKSNMDEAEEPETALSLDKLIALHDKRVFVEDIAKRIYSYILQSDFITRLDNSPYLFSLADGKKIDLRDLSISKRIEEDYLTYDSGVSFVSKTPNAEKFFKQIIPGLEEREYLRKILGYTLTGETCARSFFIWYGHGSNGKSLIFSLLNKIMGKLYHQCDKSIFIKSGRDSKGASPELVALLGKRASVYSEGETSDKIEMNMSGMKQVSGEDIINARQLYGQPIEFKANCKLHMLTNFTPSLTEESAIVARTRYIFLDTVFSFNPQKGEIKIDTAFVENLSTIFLNEVFTWITKGSKEFYTDKKIEMPDSFIRRTKQIFSSEDSISTFIERRIVVTELSTDYIKKGDLFETYKKFCDSNSQRCHKRSELFDRLSEMKYTTTILKGYDVYRFMKVIDVDINSDGMDAMNEYNRISYDLDESHRENERLQKQIYKLKGIQYKKGDIIMPKKLNLRSKHVTDFVYDIVEEEDEEEEEEEYEDNDDDEYEAMASML